MVIKLNFVQTLSTRFGQYFEVRVQGRFSIFPQLFVEVMTLNRGRDSKLYLVEILKFMFSRDADVWLRFCLVLGRDYEEEI